MAVVGIIPFFTFGLGTWQLKRLKWKIDLIDELEEKLQLPPLNFPSKINLSVIPEFVFRKVILRGRWDHAHTMIFKPRVREGVHGVHVVTPLIRENGTTILVDRGFVSNDMLPSLASHESDEEVFILGMLRTSQPKNTFTPDNKPDEGAWYWADLEAMADFAGGEKENVQPVYVEQIFAGHAGEAASLLDKGVPVGREPTVNLRNSHLSYVITWYSLSVLTAVMFGRVLLNRKRSPGKKMPRYR